MAHKPFTPEAWIPKTDSARQNLDSLHSKMEQTEIMKSPEKKAIDDFIGNLDNLPILKKIGLSAEPFKKFIAKVKEWTKKVPGLDINISEYFGDILSAVGLGFLIPKEKEETAENDKKKKKEEKAEAEKETETNEPASATVTTETTLPEPESEPEPEKTAKTEDQPKPRTETKVTTNEKYEPIPRLSERALSGREFMEEYKKLEPAQRHMLVLQQLAIGNVPDHFKQFETIRVESGKGNVLEMQVARHGLRIGTDADYVEVPLDGPTAMAAAEIYGCTLPTPWISDQIHTAAEANGGIVPFISAPEIAKRLSIEWNPNKPDGNWMRSAEFVAERNRMLREYCQKHGITDEQLTYGYHKDITHPLPGTTKPGMLEIYGGCYASGDRVQPISGGFHGAKYFDYSHQARFIRATIKINGKVMNISDFMNNLDYAKEFGFHKMPIERAYKYPSTLAAYVAQHKPKTDSKLTS